MEDDNRRVAVVIGAVAAAAGVALASYFIYGRFRKPSSPARNVTEVLADCYTKIRDIHQRLSELHPGSLNPSASQS